MGTVNSTKVVLMYMLVEDDEGFYSWWRRMENTRVAGGEQDGLKVTDTRCSHNLNI